jgi:ethanolaminephosphotransferase
MGVGIDSLNCPLAGLIMVAACGYGSTPLGLFTVLIPCPTMFLSSWEQYHTGILYLGFINGPCEGIIIACTIMGLSAVYGPGFYQQEAMNILPFIKDPSIMVHHLFVGMCLFAFFGVHLPAWYPTPSYMTTDGSFYNVYKARKARGEAFLPTLPQLIPMILFVAAHCAWLLSPYSYALKEGQLMLVGLTMTFVFGRMTTKIILVRTPPSAALTRRHT